MNKTEPHNYHVLLTDEQVLECRRRAEFEGWDQMRLVAYYGVDRKYMNKLLHYEVRSKLIPKPAR